VGNVCLLPTILIYFATLWSAKFILLLCYFQTKFILLLCYFQTKFILRHSGVQNLFCCFAIFKQNLFCDTLECKIYFASSIVVRIEVEMIDLSAFHAKVLAKMVS